MEMFSTISFVSASCSEMPLGDTVRITFWNLRAPTRAWQWGDTRHLCKSGKGLHPPQLAKIPQTLYKVPPTWTLAAKAPAVGMGKQSLEIRHDLHRTPLKSVHATAMHTEKDRPHLPQYFTLLSML